MTNLKISEEKIKISWTRKFRKFVDYFIGREIENPDPISPLSQKSVSQLCDFTLSYIMPKPLENGVFV